MDLNCEACGLAFATEREAQAHMKVHVKAAPSPKAYACDCGTAFPSERELKQHATQVHVM